MATLTKFADRMRGVNSKLADIKATTAELSLAEKKVLLEALAGDISAAATDSPTKRLASVQAAAKSTNQRTKFAFTNAVTGLAALGVKLDAVAASGDISHLDKLMRDQGWTSQRKITLKNALNIIGAA